MTYIPVTAASNGLRRTQYERQPLEHPRAAKWPSVASLGRVDCDLAHTISRLHGS